MVNVQPGFIITESCYKCSKISSYFSFESSPPLEEYRDKDHFWNVIGSSQSIRFELKCVDCNKLVEFKELSGLMMCTGCDEKCQIDWMVKKLARERTWVYVAFGFLPLDEQKPLSLEKLAILEEYFNQRRKSSTSRIKVIGTDLIDDISTCYAEIIQDVGLLSLTPPEN
jgi:hypothetical protein